MIHENFEQLSVSSDAFLMIETSQDRGRPRGTTQLFSRQPDTNLFQLGAPAGCAQNMQPP